MSTRDGPAAKPLDTLDALWGWAPDPLSALCRASVALPKATSASTPGPRLLACHDMNGGYGEDRLVQGSADAGFYCLRRWASLDTFVYFSHRLVTIPPPGWVNAAHTHGVRVLGTLITEWDAGKAACAQLFGSADVALAAAAQLAAIARCHGFEGWIINIENEVELEHIPHLLLFLRELTACMRKVAPGWSQVIWYDAVTTEGKLEWQNTLNGLNRPFFDACDALWVNYTWKEGTPAAVLQEAGERALDVYMGVDCFGRGTYGGGGFSCDVALQAALEQGLSAALFATGWPFEGDCGADAPACWRQRDTLFWEGIETAWLGGAGGGRRAGSSGSDSGTLQHQQAGSGQRRRPARLQLPLCSNFSPGCGAAFYQSGRQVSAAPWYNLSLQAPQPLLAVSTSSVGAAAFGSGSNMAGASFGSSGVVSGAAAGSGSGSSVQAVPSEERVYSGGSCVRVSGRLQPGQQAAVRLFEPSVQLPASGICVRATAVVAGGVEVSLVLQVALAGGSCAGGEGAPAGSSSGGSSSVAGGSQCGTIELRLLPSSSTPALAAAPCAASEPAGKLCGASRPVLTLSAAPISSTSCGALTAAAGEAQAGAPGATSGPGGPATAPPQPAVEAADGPAAAAPKEAAAGADTPATAAAQEAWQTFQFRLGPDQLAAAGAPLLLTAVDLLLLGVADEAGGSGAPAAGTFAVHLGEVCIEAAPCGGPPTPPRSVAALTCNRVQFSTGHLTGQDGDGSGSTLKNCMLEARLEWQPTPDDVRCCHVWCTFDGVAAAAEPQWLGAACSDAFWVSCLPVPPGVVAATFTVQPEGRNGLVQDPAAAACATVLRCLTD